MTDIGGEHDRDQADGGRRRREFIRAHHPDRGGDTEAFIAGLRGFDDEPQRVRPAPPPRPRVTVVPRQPWPSRLVTAAVRRLTQGKPPARVR
jgi:hypothetical protein